MEENNIQENTTNNVDNNSDNQVITAAEFEEIKKRERKNGRIQGTITTLIIVAAIVFVLVVAKVILGFLGITLFGSRGITGKKTTDKADNLWRMVERYYLWDADEDAAVENMYKGMLNSLGDPYSVYYTKEEFDDINESSSGKYSGIGAYVAQNMDSMDTYISNPMPGSPAEEAGLLPGDYIYEIDGEDVRGLELNVVVSKIKGPEGTDVVLSVYREGEKELLDITVTRRTIEVSMLESRMLDDNIGYIWLYEFEKIAITQFDAAYKELENQGMEGLIVDLRSNPGGDLEAVVDLCDEFLPKGVIVYTKDKNGKGESYTSDSKYLDIPLVLIVDGNSASASEIFTGSLKDYKRATVVGTTTYGKGIVQSLFGLADGTAVKITESEYYLPNDECIHGVGIEPDIEVKFDSDRYKKDDYDNQLEKAIEVMKDKLKESKNYIPE